MPRSTWGTTSSWRSTARSARRHPLREHVHAQPVLALYRCGRRAEALEAYQGARQILAEELGVEPGAPLRELYQAILTGHAALAAPWAGRDSDGPASAAAVAVPRQLPAGIPHFTGRADALRTLTSLARGDQWDECRCDHRRSAEPQGSARAPWPGTGASRPPDPFLTGSCT